MSVKSGVSEAGGNGAAEPGLATAELFALVYHELKELARRRMAGERKDHTLQATALVHEVYLRLAGDETAKWEDPAHFFFAAAESMRRILIDHARARGNLKRGGKRVKVSLNVVDLLATDDQIVELLALDEVLKKLERDEPDVAAVVRLRFYAGLSIEQVAEVLKLSPRSVSRDWTYARAMLFRALEDGEASPARAASQEGSK